jgi:hypothetical protein
MSVRRSERETLRARFFMLRRQRPVPREENALILRAE